jgi:hypothetical protein
MVTGAAAFAAALYGLIRLPETRSKEARLVRRNQPCSPHAATFTEVLPLHDVHSLASGIIASVHVYTDGEYGDLSSSWPERIHRDRALMHRRWLRQPIIILS